MTWPAVGLMISVVGTLVAIQTDNAALMALGFMCFAIALASGDVEADSINRRASDNLNVLGRDRIGYEDDEERAA